MKEVQSILQLLIHSLSTTGNITNVNATTVDSANLEVTNIKARDGTSSATIADTTGVMTIPSSVLTTSDINGGNIDNTIIGSQTPSSATFTNITVNDQNAIIFEGSTGDNYETTISIEDPTDDRTITVPNISGTLLTNSHSVTALSDVTNAGSGIIISDSERTKLNNIEVGATGDQTASEIGTLLGEVGGHIIPTSDEQYDLGSSTYKFRTLYLAGDTIKLGNSDIKADSSGNISVFEGGTTTLKKLVVDELEIGTGQNKVILAKDESTGGFKAQTLNKSNNSKGGAKVNLSNNNTGELSEGTNKYFTESRSRGSISVQTTEGKEGDLSYNSSNGILTYTGPDPLIPSTGINIENNNISIGQAVSTTSNVTFNDVTVSGNFTVNGETTQVNTSTLNIEDPILKLAKDNTDDSVDIGFYGLYNTSSTDKYSGIYRDASDSGKWKIFKDLTVEPTSTVQSTESSYSIGTLVSNIEGGIIYTSLNDGTTTLTSTVQELNYVDGVTSSIQTQIDSKQPNLTAGTNLSFDGNTLNASAKPLSITGSVDAVQNNVTTNDVGTITFDKDSGFTVNASGTDITVGLGSHWKTLTAVTDGGEIGTTSSITPTGQEDLKLVAGNNIKLSLDDTEDDQKVKFQLVDQPSISTIINTGTLTLPTSTDTLVGRDTTDTLTNKTLTSPDINGGTIDSATISTQVI